MEAVGKHAFNATNDDELSFEKGAILKVLAMDTGQQWFKAELDGHCGLVPANYIQLKPHEWYHGKISRSEAEELLMNSGPNGAFLIRESESTPGDFSLSVKNNSAVEHFKVLRDGAGKYFLWVVKFNSLNQLVEYHRTSSVSRTQTIYLKDLQLQAKTESMVRALYDFQAEETGELSFKKGDIIELLENIDDNWSKGKSDSGEGCFPRAYVEATK